MSNINGLTKVVTPQSSHMSGSNVNTKSYKSSIQNAVSKNLGMKPIGASSKSKSKKC